MRPTRDFSTASMRHLAVVVALFGGGALCAAACGESDKADEKDSGASDDAATAPTDVGQQQDTADAGPPKVLRWQQQIPSHGKKLRAIAAVTGKPGHYVVVGDSASVLLFEDGAWKDISPKNIGEADIKGVHVDDKGRIVIAGDKSALAIREAGKWLIAGEVPPTPAVQFLDVSGEGENYWAVGFAGQAWRHADAAWTAQAVTVTDGGEGIGTGAQFVAVASRNDEVWIACEPGATSAGLALRKNASGWTSFSLPIAARAIWVAPDKVEGGVLVAGGTNNEFVARFDGKKFVLETDLKWKQGFSAIDGLSASAIWVAGFKGQLRKSTDSGWDVVAIEAPPGTPKPFPPPTADLVGVAVHDVEEMAVITNFRLYRYGKQ